MPGVKPDPVVLPGGPLCSFCLTFFFLALGFILSVLSLSLSLSFSLLLGF